MYRWIVAASIALAAVSVARAQSAFFADLPAGFPKPPMSADNVLTPEKAELGRHLFYDTRLSENGTQSCASCHKQALAFTDGRDVSAGSTGQLHPRGSMSLVNVVYSRTFNWVGEDVISLEQQAKGPMFNASPVELGLPISGDTLVARLRAVDKYRTLFAGAFPGDASPVSVPHVLDALASFERTIVSARSPYDRYHFGGDDSAVTPEAKRGEVIFYSQPFACFTCHGGPNFTSRGLHGGFKAPTLRNIQVTAPYMHDGSVKMLGDTLRHNNPNDPLSPYDALDLTAFLASLTDRAVLTDPRFSNPWPATSRLSQLRPGSR